MTESAQAIVEIDKLSYRYAGAAADKLALREVSLSINRGEIFGFLGPNGSGKTTLFRILSTLIPAPPGRVRMLGHDLDVGRDAIRRQIGVVFQSPSLDKQLTADENLRCHGHLYGLRGAELSGRIDRLLARFGMSEHRRQRVEKFSGGMRRRIELAKGLLNQPALLILDEPSTGLDPSARIDLWKCLDEIRGNDGVTVLLTTHLMDEADRCTRLAVLDRGRLVACDRPALLKERIGGDVITLHTSNPGEVAAGIETKFGIHPETLDAVVRLERARGHEFVPQLIEAMPGLIDSVTVGKPTLEDVFIDVTGHTFRDQA